MAPTMRTHTQTRRGNRAGYQEHDDFEGLPVRQWRQEWVNIAPPPAVETTQKNDLWAIELPYGMPKDSNLLPTHTQELLRAARSGRLYKRPAPAEEEEADPDAAPEKPEKKEEDASTKGYMVKMWKQVPRNAEGPTISHLAKRRKGTVTLSSSLPAGNATGPAVTKATVRRIDAAGNPYNQEVILTAGQAVDGEIISTTVVQAPTANVNADGAGATPARRRPPPPKRKAKGPGRGRKKKLPLPGPSIPQNGIAGAAVAEGNVKQEGATDGIKQEEGGDDNKRQDSEMADGDDDDEGDDDGDDGDEGDEGDDDDGDVADSEKGTPIRNEGSADQEMKDSPSVEPPVMTAPASHPDAMDISVEEPVSTAPPAQPTLALAPVQAASLASPIFEGSPLKNVLIPSPTEPAPPLPPPTSTIPEPTSESKARSLSPVPIASVPENVEASDLQTTPSAELAAPVPSVEPPPTAEPETDYQETTIIETRVTPEPAAPETQVVEETVVETQAPVDTEMTDFVPSVELETVVESNLLSSTETSDGPVLVEEVIETTNVPLNDELAPAELPTTAEETSIVASVAIPSVSEPEVTKDSTPVIEEPAFVSQEVSTTEIAKLPEQSEQAEQSEQPQQVGQSEQPEEPQPPVTQVTGITDLRTEPVVEVPPAPVDEPAAILPALNPLLTASAVPAPLLDEREPESPDLLGGLEAALDRHSEPRGDLKNDGATAEHPEVTATEAQPEPEPTATEVVSDEKQEEPSSAKLEEQPEEKIPEQQEPEVQAEAAEKVEETPIAEPVEQIESKPEGVSE